MKRLFAAAAVAALVLTACSSPTEDTVTIGLTYIPDIQFAPFYVAEANGYLPDNVQLRHHGAQEGLFTAIESGDEQLVVAGADEMLQAFDGGIDLVTTGVMYQNYPTALIVPADSPIQSVSDLEGRTVGIPGPYGENYFSILSWLNEAGLDETRVNVESIGYTQQAALSTGDVDAVVGFVNNDLVQFERAGIDVRVVETPELPLVGASIGSIRDTVDPETLAAIQSGISQAIQDIIADPEAAVALSFEAQPDLAVTSQQEAALTTLMVTIPLYGDGCLAVDEEMWGPMYTFMTSAGLVSGESDPSLAVDASIASVQVP